MRACLSKKIYLAHYYYEASLRSICSNALTRYVAESLSLLLLLLLAATVLVAVTHTTVHIQLNKHTSINDTAQWLNMHSGISVVRCMLQWIQYALHTVHSCTTLLHAVCPFCHFTALTRWKCVYFAKLVCTLCSALPTANSTFHPNNRAFSFWPVAFFFIAALLILLLHFDWLLFFGRFV